MLFRIDPATCRGLPSAATTFPCSWPLSKKAIIERTLQKTGGNRAEAARLLDLNPKYFSALCKELNVKPE